jgi:hypothetical protein
LFADDCESIEPSKYDLFCSLSCKSPISTRQTREAAKKNEEDASIEKLKPIKRLGGIQEAVPCEVLLPRGLTERARRNE